MYHRVFTDQAIVMKVLAISIQLLALSYFLYQWWKIQGPAVRKYFLPSLLAKLLAGSFVGIIYTYYYEAGDTFLYFRDGSMLAGLAKKNFTTYLNFLWSEASTEGSIDLVLNEPRALFFVKFVSLLCLLTFDNYWLTACYFSAISFAGAWFLFKKLNHYFPPYTFVAFVSFLFFPSIVFWTSGLVKECLASASLFFLTGLFLKAWFDKSIDVILSLISLLALWVLWSLKYYYAAIFLPVVFTCMVHRYLFVPVVKPKHFSFDVILWGIIFVFPLLLITLIHPNFYLERFLEVVVSNNEIYNQFSSKEDIIKFYDLHPTIGSIAKNAPLALVSGLFRPFIFESGNILQHFAAFENSALLLLAMVGFTRIKKIPGSPHRILILAVLLYIILLCVFLTLSTPNFGTLSRYRIGYLPYFVFIILCDNPFIKFLERTSLRLAR